MDRINTIDPPTGRRLMNPAPNLQRDILEALNITEQDLKSYAAP